MKRTSHPVREGWQKKVEGVGLTFHTPNGQPYWDESAYYSLTSKEVEELELSTGVLHEMCLEAAQHVIDKKRYAEFGIPSFAIPAIEASWEREPAAIYGRMDLAYTGKGPAKLLEYNADTPTSLLEASVVQWEWLKETFPTKDQWNSIHERLVEKWVELREGSYIPEEMHFAHILDPSHEDALTTTYLRDTAEQVGIPTRAVAIEDIQFDGERFMDAEGHLIDGMFKLYPWEWLINEEGGAALLKAVEKGEMVVMEPVWKMLLSNKAILPVLWEMFPNHPNLLPAFFARPDEEGGSYVKKPKLSREGANTSIYLNGKLVVETGGDYGEEGFVVQQLADTQVEGKTVVLGSWVIDGVSAGVGFRESDSLITDNLARFVPHLIEG